MQELSTRTRSEVPEVAQRLASFAGLSPLQLAVKLGNERMYRHLLRKQTIQMWDWGPLRGYEICIVPRVENARPRGIGRLEKRPPAAARPWPLLRVQGGRLLGAWPSLVRLKAAVGL